MTAPNGLPGLREALAAEGHELLRAWPRGPDHLLLHVRPATDGTAVPGRGPAWCAGQWFSDVARAAHVAERTRDAHPGDGGVRHLPGTGAVLQPGGADRRLTGLAALLRPPGATLLVHRPERRAVVRDAAGATFTKVVRPEHVPALAGSAGWRPPGVRVPAVLAVDPDAGTVTTAAVPGRTPYELGALATPSAWEAAGRAVAALHRASPPRHARPHPLPAEAGVTRTWLERAASHQALPASAAAELQQAADRALARLEASGAVPAPVTVHRDLHDKQLLLHGDDRGGWGVSLLDLDLLATAEPALDVANLLVHLLLRDEQSALHGAPGTGAGPAAQAFLSGYGPVPGLRRVADLAVLAAVRVAAVYAFRAAHGGDPADRDVGGPRLGQRLLAAVTARLPGLLGTGDARTLASVGRPTA